MAANTLEACALVTGAARRLGRAIAQDLARAGWRIAVHYQSSEADALSLVAEIEAGRPNGAAARRILEEALEPMLARGLDTVVLGCTHYPFAFDTIREIVGPDVRLLDPAPAIARRVANLLDTYAMANPAPGDGATRFFTSGAADEAATRIQQLIGEDVRVEQVQWLEGEVRHIS